MAVMNSGKANFCVATSLNLPFHRYSLPIDAVDTHRPKPNTTTEVTALDTNLDKEHDTSGRQYYTN